MPSVDGTPIAVWTRGAGPPLVLVHGATLDHTTWELLLPHLDTSVTTHAIDRRGRGCSGDRPAYALAREHEDVAAVVDAVAEEWGGPVDLLGHSFGGLVTLGAAARTARVRRLVLYEGWPASPERRAARTEGLLPAVEQLLAQGRREAALERFYREAIGLSDEEVAGIRALPSWPARVAAAPTLGREIRAVREGVDRTLIRQVAAPTLLLVGAASPVALADDAHRLAAVLPAARVEVLSGQGHLAHRRAPALLAERVLAFLTADDAGQGQDQGRP